MAPKPALDLIRGTLDVLILKALSWGPQHGYAVARWVRQQTDNAMLIEEGALYPALYRLEAQELIESSWGTSENNRRARFYRMTAAGRRRLQADTDTWSRYAQAVARGDAVIGAGGRFAVGAPPAFAPGPGGFDRRDPGDPAAPAQAAREIAVLRAPDLDRLWWGETQGNHVAASGGRERGSSA